MSFRARVVYSVGVAMLSALGVAGTARSQTPPAATEITEVAGDKSCVDSALELLGQRIPAARALVESDPSGETRETFVKFLECGPRMVLSLPSGVHEATHIRSRIGMDDFTRHRFYALDGTLRRVLTLPTAPRRIVLSAVPVASRGDYYDLYMDTAGDQSFLYQLDELNAYKNELPVAVALLGDVHLFVRSANRDGLLAMLSYTLAYLDVLDHPGKAGTLPAGADLTATRAAVHGEEILALTDVLLSESRAALRGSCALSENDAQLLGIDDVRYTAYLRTLMPTVTAWFPAQAGAMQRELEEGFGCAHLRPAHTRAANTTRHARTGRGRRVR